MIRFLSIRLLQSLLVILVMSALIYGLIGLMPGDPIDLMVAGNPHLTSADAERLRKIYGLDQPLWQRYANWLGAVLQGDLGYSRLFARPVPEILVPRIINTGILIGLAFSLALAIALPVGVQAARRPGSTADTAVNLLCFAGISVPPFWLALLLIMLFAVTLGWLPAGGMAPASSADPLDRLPYLVLPVLTLTLASVGGYTRYVRSAMREALRHDHIRTARAKGVSEARIVWGHALQTAMVPVVTIIGLEFGTLFSGALITETMFSYLGMGKLIYDGIMGNDFNIALAALLFATGMTLIGNLLADIAYAGLDPRITFGERQS